MKALLRNYRQSSRKVRLLADLVRGKDIDRAIVLLRGADKRASSAVSKLISSATSNAENNEKKNRKDLIVKEIRVDEGVTLKRFRARARGNASAIHKRTSRIMVVLGDKIAQKTKAEKPKETVKRSEER